MADSKWPRILWCRVICRLFPLTSTISGACSAARDIVLHRVSDIGQGFDKLGAFGGVFERLPELFHSGVDSMFEINERVFLPEGSSYLLARDNFSFGLQKQPQHLEWLFLNRHTHPGAEQFTAAQIDLERVKACTRPR